MAKKKLTRKQLLTEPDEFITLTSRIIQWSRQHPKRLIYTGAAIIALIAIGVGINAFSDHRSRMAFSLLSQGLNRIHSMDETQPAEALSSVEADFSKLISSYDGQSAGKLGRIIYAHHQLAKGAVDQAVDLYQKALHDYRQDPALTAIIENGLASAYVQKNMPTEAISQYEKIVQGAGSILKDSALFHLGSLYRSAGEAEKSNQAYARLASEFPESMYTQMVEATPAS